MHYGRMESSNVRRLGMNGTRRLRTMNQMSAIVFNSECEFFHVQRARYDAFTWQLPTFSGYVYVIENANKYFKFFINE